MTEGMKLWIEELRSGKYVQGKGFMKQSFGRGKRIRHCALGVGYEAAKKAGLKVEDRKDPFDGVHYLNSHFSFPDPTVSDWLGLRPLGGSGCSTLEIEVSQMNDNGKTFEEIADWLEQRFGGGGA